MILNNERLDSIVITSESKNTGSLVTADDEKEVIAIISDDNIIVKDGYVVKLVPATS
jgi:hypothetical protein